MVDMVLPPEGFCGQKMHVHELLTHVKNGGMNGRNEKKSQKLTCSHMNMYTRLKF